MRTATLSVILVICFAAAASAAATRLTKAQALAATAAAPSAEPQFVDAPEANDPTVEVDVAPDGTEYIVTKSGAIYKSVACGRWQRLPGKARGVAAGPNGALYVMGWDRINHYGYRIYKLVGNAFQLLEGDSGLVVAITVDGTGRLWAVNGARQIFRRNGLGWDGLNGLAYDIGAGGDGKVYVIGTNNAHGGRGIWRYNNHNNTFTEIGGAALRVDVDADGYPWVVNDGGLVYKRNGANSAWINIGSGARDIGVGSDAQNTFVSLTPA